MRSKEHALPASNIFEDNKSVIKWVKNPCARSLCQQWHTAWHTRVNHIDGLLKALRQLWTEDQEIDIVYIEMHKQLGDALTKTLTPTKQ